MRLIRTQRPIVRALLQWMPVTEGTERDYVVIADYGSAYDPEQLHLAIGFQVNEQDERQHVHRIADYHSGDIRERRRAAPFDMQPWLEHGPMGPPIEFKVVTQQLREVEGIRREALIIRHVEPLLRELQQLPGAHLESFLCHARS